MKTSVAVALLGLLAVIAVPGALAASRLDAPGRRLSTIGPDDVAAAAAVGQAAVATGLSASYAAKKIALAKKKEAYANYKAERKVADAMDDAMRHAAKYAHDPVKAAKHAVDDAEDIAEAIADAKAIKLKAKAKSMKIVAKSMIKVAEINVKYGGKAALAVGNAALNDAAFFAPIVAGLAPALLPPLAAGLGAGATGLQSALGSVARAIGGAVLGRIGVEGPDLLANRVAGLLPDDLLSRLGDLDIDVPATLLRGGDGLEGLVGNMPPQVLDLVAGFLSGNANAGPAGLLPPLGPAGDIPIPAAAIRAILEGLNTLTREGGNPLNIGLNLPDLPAAGLPFPLRALGNLLGVLPRPNLMNVLNLLPRPPLLNLIGNLPLGISLP